MTKLELIDFLNAQLLTHTAGLSYGYSQGKLNVQTPDRHITEVEFRTGMIALQLAFVDAIESLGLVNSG